MSHTHHSETWTAVCTLRDIVPNTGVCALVDKAQIAVFRVGAGQSDNLGGQGDHGDRVFAVSNYDPNSNAAVLSRGLVGSLGERIVVASPIYKHHFDLQTGECLEAPELSITAYPARVYDGKVWVAA
ncbi:nitrite reductase small subunit NirD [Cupriavidus sp. CV2]|uniref:nitrite reductase small subunit NirD n=1 Tax=Cupriavidus ulmosensis TaxID=3065913 RepID=UPI00296AE896|nr:nitrite reductase small subunit NirD [Cupriavidus sp. CV2]MDW3685207.1 nitrite reductase small subunit NirD [Cupriavidus sp. CV2]